MTRREETGTPRVLREELEGARVTIMGLGLHGGGAAAARFCAERGARVTVTDLQTESALASSLEGLADLPDIRYVLGRHREEDFREADMVIKNPAVPRTVPYLAMARRIETDISLFLAASPLPLIAVTGTKGKSSTASAIHYGLQQRGLISYLGGNITISPLSFLEEIAGTEPAPSEPGSSEPGSSERLRPEPSGAVAVLEISSFQLGDLLMTPHPERLRPRVAVITNIFEDHQDYYGSMEAYVADKSVIYRFQTEEDVLIYHQDDAYGPGFGTEAPSRGLAVSAAPLPAELPGAYLLDADPSAAVGALVREEAGGAPRPLLPAKTALPGRHNRMNLSIAALALTALGVAPEDAGAAVADFPGIPHRLEEVGSIDGVRFVNDSAATIPDAAREAVEAFREPVFLIAGGSDKNGSFESFREILPKTRRCYLLEGSGSRRILDTLSGDVVAGTFSSLRQAVERAFADARREAADTAAVVLLSPGAASFGMFRNEFDRGRQFAELAREIMARSR